MFKKEILIIFIGLSVVTAMLILGWVVFVKQEVPVQVVMDDGKEVVDDVGDDDISPIVKDDDNFKENVHKILFAHMNGGSSIWIVNEDGSDLEQIVSEDIRNSYSTVLSPEKNKIAYISIETSEKDGIRIIDLITDESILLASYDKNQTGIGHPKFSPDGKQLAYLTQENKKSIIYITTLSDLITRKVIEFTSVYRISAGEMNMRWSPDGKKIVYLHDNDICITDLNGNTQKIVFGGEPEKGGDLAGNEWDIFTIRGLSFSSNGKQIKYIKNNNRFIVDVDGKNNKQLEQITLEKNNDKYTHVLEFILNSDKVLVLESWPKGHDPYMQRLLLYDIGSKETKVIYEGDKYYNPKISPDGKFIAVSVSEDFRDKDKEGMYFINLNGEVLEKITSVSYYKILEWK